MVGDTGVCGGGLVLRDSAVDTEKKVSDEGRLIVNTFIVFAIRIRMVINRSSGFQGIDIERENTLFTLET